MFQTATSHKEGGGQRNNNEMQDIHGQMSDLRSLSAQAGIKLAFTMIVYK